ncbi:hypothetical protein GCM10009851_01260 [Herbiconiux moechotypicola]|uniref:Bacterial Ig-like domain-containing protein n=1 Tax=Herbiconiux moechotypicola TaxID=637393 RepID=A0ABP5Q0U6_9MICO
MSLSAPGEVAYGASIAVSARVVAAVEDADSSADPADPVATVAPVAPVSGTVQFSDSGGRALGDPVIVVDGQAVLDPAALRTSGGGLPTAPGVTVRAEFLPADESEFAPSSAETTVAIRQGSTSTAVEFTSDRSLQAGRSISATAIVTRSAGSSGLDGMADATGTVEFYYDGALVSTATVFSVPGDARAYALSDITLGGAGDRSLVAVYSGDAVFAASTSGTAIVSVSPATDSAGGAIAPPVAPQPAPIAAPAPASTGAASGSGADGGSGAGESGGPVTVDADSVSEQTFIAPGFWLVFMAIFAGMLLVASSAALVVTQLRLRRTR